MYTLNLPTFEKNIDRIRDILKGYETPLISFCAANTKEAFYNLCDELLETLPENTPKEERQLYLLFLRTSMCFLESSCDDEDKTFISLKKLSNVEFYSKGDKCVFEYMLDNAEIFERDEHEMDFYELTKSLYADFRSVAEKMYDKAELHKQITQCVEAFLFKNNLMISPDEYKNSRIEFHIETLKTQIVKEYYRVKQVKENDG